MTSFEKPRLFVEFANMREFSYDCNMFKVAPAVFSSQHLRFHMIRCKRNPNLGPYLSGIGFDASMQRAVG